MSTIFKEKTGTSAYAIEESSLKICFGGQASGAAEASAFAKATADKLRAEATRVRSATFM